MSDPASANVHAGMASGGQAGSGGLADGQSIDSEIDTAPVPITALGLADGNSLYLTDFDLGDDVFATVEVHRAGERYTATGTVPVDLYGEVAGGTDRAHPADRAITRLVTDREADISTFLADRYGAALKHETERDEAAVAFRIDLNPATDTTGDILDKLRAETRALALRNDLVDTSDGGFYLALRAALDRP